MKICKKKKTHAYNSLATFRLNKVKVHINGRLKATYKIIMEISLLIMEKSWNNHGILILNFSGNPAFICSVDHSFVLEDIISSLLVPQC